MGPVGGLFQKMYKEHIRQFNEMGDGVKVLTSEQVRTVRLSALYLWYIDRHSDLECTIFNLFYLYLQYTQKKLFYRRTSWLKCVSMIHTSLPLWELFVKLMYSSKPVRRDEETDQSSTYTCLYMQSLIVKLIVNRWEHSSFSYHVMCKFILSLCICIHLYMYLTTSFIQ